MRITESQLRRIVRQEINEMVATGPLTVADLKSAVGRRVEVLSPVSRWVNELGRKVVILPVGSIVNLYEVRPTHSAPGIVRGSTPGADRVGSESPYSTVVLEVEILHGGESGPEGAMLGRGDIARIVVMPDEVRLV